MSLIAGSLKFMSNMVNKTRVVTTIAIVAATLVGSAILFMPSVQQPASAQCEPRGNPEKGAQPFDCVFGGGIECKGVFTPSPRLQSIEPFPFRCK